MELCGHQHPNEIFWKIEALFMWCIKFETEGVFNVDTDGRVLGSVEFED